MKNDRKYYIFFAVTPFSSEKCLWIVGIIDTQHKEEIYRLLDMKYELAFSCGILIPQTPKMTAVGRTRGTESSSNLLSQPVAFTKDSSSVNLQPVIRARQLQSV